MTDDELIGYAYIHAQTPRALFHTSHVVRLLDLAGANVPENLRQANNFVSVPLWDMVPILEAIRARKAA